jgi:hypothetical protein
MSASLRFKSFAQPSIKRSCGVLVPVSHPHIARKNIRGSGFFGDLFKTVIPLVPDIIKIVSASQGKGMIAPHKLDKKSILREIQNELSHSGNGKRKAKKKYTGGIISELI